MACGALVILRIVRVVVVYNLNRGLVTLVHMVGQQDLMKERVHWEQVPLGTFDRPVRHRLPGNECTVPF